MGKLGYCLFNAVSFCIKQVLTGQGYTYDGHAFYLGNQYDPCADSFGKKHNHCANSIGN